MAVGCGKFRQTHCEDYCLSHVSQAQIDEFKKYMQNCAVEMGAKRMRRLAWAVTARHTHREL